MLLYIALDASLINSNLYQPLGLSIAEVNPERLKTSVYWHVMCSGRYEGYSVEY